MSLSCSHPLHKRWRGGQQARAMRRSDHRPAFKVREQSGWCRGVRVAFDGVSGKDVDNDDESMYVYFSVA